MLECHQETEEAKSAAEARQQRLVSSAARVKEGIFGEGWAEVKDKYYLI